MRIMAIIGIVLFTWLFINRTELGAPAGAPTSTTVADDNKAAEMVRSKPFQLAAVSVYGFIFSLFVLVRGSKRSSVDEAKDMTILTELREKGLINDIEFETAKKKITGV